MKSDKEELKSFIAKTVLEHEAREDRARYETSINTIMGKAAYSNKEVAAAPAAAPVTTTEK